MHFYFNDLSEKSLQWKNYLLAIKVNFLSNQKFNGRQKKYFCTKCIFARALAAIQKLTEGNIERANISNNRCVGAANFWIYFLHIFFEPDRARENETTRRWRGEKPTSAEIAQIYLFAIRKMELAKPCSEFLMYNGNTNELTFFKIFIKLLKNIFQCYRTKISETADFCGSRADSSV